MREIGQALSQNNNKTESRQRKASEREAMTSRSFADSKCFSLGKILLSLSEHNFPNAIEPIDVLYALNVENMC